VAAECKVPPAGIEDALDQSTGVCGCVECELIVPTPPVCICSFAIYDLLNHLRGSQSMSSW
jgi:hypothetical protein